LFVFTKYDTLLSIFARPKKGEPMPKKSSASKRKTTKIELPKEFDVSAPSDHKCSGCCSPLNKISKTGYAAIIFTAVILFLIAINRGLVFAAIVNGKPIFRSTLIKTLTTRYGQQTLDNMISERLIADEAKKLGVTVTKEEIDTKEQDILKSFGGNVTIDEILKYQGMTKTDFDEQIRLQMLLTKLIGKNITISDDDISNYIATNSAVLTATDEAGMRTEAKDAILMEKVGEQIQTWFTDLKNKAKIMKFIQ